MTSQCPVSIYTSLEEVTGRDSDTPLSRGRESTPSLTMVAQSLGSCHAAQIRTAQARGG